MKRVLSCLLTLAVIINLCTGIVFAKEAVVFDITAQETVYPGKTVTVTVSAEISADTEVQGLQADFEYSENFPEIKTEITENTIGWTNVGLKKKNLLGVGVVSAAGGILKGTISFDVPEDALIGTVYTISFDDIIASTATEEAESAALHNSVSVTVVDFPEIEDVQITGYDGVYDGAEHTISVNIPEGSSIKYSTDGENYAETLASYKNVCNQTIYYIVSMEDHKDKTGSAVVKISEKELSDAMVENITAQQYTGAQIRPEITVKDGEPSIITANDYDISYGENINVATGGSVTITGKGNYKGTVIKNFEISKATMSVNQENYNGVYDGKAHKGSVSVSVPVNAEVKYGTTDGTYNLTEMPEYTNAGTYTIYYKATAENYSDATGSVTVTITQKELSNSMLQSISAQDYTGVQIKPAVTLSDGEPSILTTNDYDISYGENINVSTGGNVTVTGKGNYKSSISKNFPINPIDMTVSAENYTGTYDGQAHKAGVSVTSPASAQIKYGTTTGAYNLNEMPGYTNAGTYTVYYKATAGNYKDSSGSVTVTIEKKAVTESMIENITAQAFTGTQIKPGITVKDGEPSIITANDYDISYGENINVSTGGSVTITGKGNYKGSAVKTFEISSAVLKVEKQNYSGIYDGKAHKAIVTVLDNTQHELKYGTVEGTYNLSEMPEYTNVGTYTVYYQATADNYSSASGSVTVQITAKTLTDDMVANVADYTYSAGQIKPDITVNDGSPSIITENDYDVSYGENTSVSTGGSITITGKGNYTGTVGKTFNINKAELTISTENKQITYGDEYSIDIIYSGFAGSETKDNLTSQATVTGLPQHLDAGEYDIVLSGAEAENYNITYAPNAKLTVNKKDISISSLEVFDKVYDETTAAVINISNIVFEGVVAGDAVSIDIDSAGANFVSSDIGDEITVEITNLAIGGSSAKNYTLTNTTYTTKANIKSNITAAYIAEKIKNIIIDTQDTTLKLPAVPNGYTVTLKSTSDNTVVSEGGEIFASEIEKSADIVLTVSNADGTDTADTDTITVTVPAKEKITVTLISDGNGTITGSGEYWKDTQITIAATANTGYVFAGWYDGDTLVSSNASYTFTVVDNINLTAKFNLQTSGRSGGGSSSAKVSLKLNTNGGESLKNITITKNTTVGDLPIPSKEGYTFEGWYSDEACTIKFDENQKLTADLTLYAKWSEDKEDDGQDNSQIIKWNNPFADVSENNWFYEAVKFANENKLFKGVSDTQFAPNESLTRGMLATVLYRLEGEPQTKASSKFADIGNNEYYTNAIVWAEENGIVNGITDTNFAPNENITREQIAAIIFRYAKNKGISSENIDMPYTDLEMISDWAIEAVSFCYANGIMLGDDTGAFNPQKNATRAETAAILQRYFK